MEKWALISGSSKGIGSAIAMKFASQGYSVIINGRNELDLENAKSRIIAAFPECTVFAIKADMSEKEGVNSLVQSLKMITTRLDVLVNNAGVYLSGSVLEEEESQLPMMIQTNLYSAYFLTRGVIDLLKKTQGSHIFNMCSIASEIAYPGGGSYSISKFALLGFSKVLREELKLNRVKVTSVLPGATWSDSWKGVDLPRERLMEPEAVADLIWAASILPPEVCVEEMVLRPILGDL